MDINSMVSMQADSADPKALAIASKSLRSVQKGVPAEKFEHLLQNQQVLQQLDPSAELTNAALPLSEVHEQASEAAEQDAPQAATANLLQVWQAWLPSVPAPAAPAASAGLDIRQPPLVASGDTALETAANVSAQAQAPDERAKQSNAARELSGPAIQANEGQDSGANALETIEAALGPTERSFSAVLEAAAPREANPALSELGHAAAGGGSEPRTAATPRSVPNVSVQIPTPLRSPEWSSAFGEQIVMLVRDGEERAELHLDPVELGPIDITLVTHNERVRASFSIAHPATLEAVQAALPKLEQMLAEQGVTLDAVSVDVNDSQREEHSAQRFNEERGNSARGERSSANSGGEEGKPASHTQARRVGLVDTFA